MVGNPPAAAWPKALHPTLSQQDIHIFARAFLPKHSLSKFTPFLMDLLSKKSLAGCARIGSSEILCDDVRNMLY